MESELLTIAELAARLKVSGRTVCRLLGAGVLPVRMVGCQKRFRWSEVVEALPRWSAPEAQQRSAPMLDLVPMLKERVRQMRRVG